MAAGKDTDNAEQTKRVDAPNASERGDASNGLLNEVHDDRMRQLNDRSAAKDVGTERNKETAENSRTLDGAASAAKSGNLEALGKSVSEIYDRANGDGAKVKELSKQLSDRLKEDGIGVQADKDTFTFQKNGKAVNFAVKAELDYGTGEVKHSAKPVNNGEDPKVVLNGFNGKKAAESAAGTFSTTDSEKQDAKRSVTGESGKLTGPDASGEEKTKKSGSDIAKENQKAADQNVGGGVARIPLENPNGLSLGDQSQAMSAKEVISDGKDKKVPTSEEMPFKGQEIKRDVPYEKTVVGPGQTLSQISAEHLGKGAGQGEIQKHVDEIAKFNGIKDPDKIKPGDALTLPGHTKEGGTITFDNNGSRITASSDGKLNVERQDGSGYFRFAKGVENHYGPRPQDNYSIAKNKDGSSTVSDWRGDTTTTNNDGSVRKEHTDGTGYVRQPGDKGSFTQQNFGPKPEDNFNIMKGTDGKFRISDGKDDKVGREPKNDTERLQLERERLKDGFDGAHGKDIQAIDRNIRDMKAFEKRAGEQGLSKEEIAKTYDHISQILEAKGDTPLTARDRTRVSDQVLHQAAHPEEVRQGFHNTCNVSTVEHRMYTKNPSGAARVVSEAARTGQVTTADGRSVKLPESSLKADS